MLPAKDLVLAPREMVREMNLSPDQVQELKAETRKAGRCGSLNTPDGLPCRKRPRVGFTVCFTHGERTPATTNKAERLLAIARMPAIEWILNELDHSQEETCDKCGYPSMTTKARTRFDRLAFKLLSITGFGPSKTINVNTDKSNEADVVVEEMTEDERLELTGLLDQVKVLKDRVKLRLVKVAAHNIVEGEVVQRQIEGESVNGEQ